MKTKQNIALKIWGSGDGKHFVEETKKLCAEFLHGRRSRYYGECRPAACAFGWIVDFLTVLAMFRTFC